MWYCIFSSIILISVCGLLNYLILRAQHIGKPHVYFCGIVTVITVIILCVLWLTELFPTPSALDVYRGNTELEITSVNGIPIDTIVVFKNK